MRNCQADEVLQGVKVTEVEAHRSNTAASRPSGPADERPSLSVSSVAVAGPSGPRQSDHASTSHPEFPSTSSTQENVATERSRPSGLTDERLYRHLKQTRRTLAKGH